MPDRSIGWFVERCKLAAGRLFSIGHTSRFGRVCRPWTAGALAVLLGAGSAAASDEIHEGTFEAERIFETLALNGAHRLISRGDGFMVLDRMNHRLLELSASGDVVRQYGRVDQAPGEMQFPFGYAIGPSGTIRVVTSYGLFLVHSFSPDGELLKTIQQGATPEEAQIYTSYSIAADSRDRFYLNQPRLGSVLTVYSAEGEKQAAVGDLLVPEDVFPDCDRHIRCRDRRFATRINRVVMTSDQADSIVMAFTAAPIVRKYSAGGDLEFETRLQGALVDELVELAMQEPEAWEPHVAESLQTDGISALAMLQDVAVEPRTGLIYCLVGSRQLHVLSRTGELVATLAQLEGRPGVSSLSVSDGTAYLTRFLATYRATLDRSILENI